MSAPSPNTAAAATAANAAATAANAAATAANAAATAATAGDVELGLLGPNLLTHRCTCGDLHLRLPLPADPANQQGVMQGAGDQVGVGRTPAVRDWLRARQAAAGWVTFLAGPLAILGWS
ncbi:hypothetical protein B0T21DRAFT_408862 [Apiosordaria backusii]|uniref:Uncharacterized protein n=1 Tax=Apiosordaria backusii TaxID=314023 RepID=A0AA40EME4_9PEZI|nr:hypothetical protein B0T21DRAFT_408862 [Apiosordaria backusii]